MSGNRKILECKITVEGMYLPMREITKAFTEKGGYETVERPINFDNYRNCTKAEIEVYRIEKGEM